MSIEYQMQFRQESEWSSENLKKHLLGRNSREFFTMEDMYEAYRYGLNFGEQAQTRRTIFATICESFFHKIYMHYAITLNTDKIKEALELIYQFSKCCDIEGDNWVEYQDKIIEKMRDWK